MQSIGERPDARCAVMDEKVMEENRKTHSEERSRALRASSLSARAGTRCLQQEAVTWEALCEHVFFDRIEKRFEDALVRCARFEEHAPGSLIAERGAIRASIYVVVRGRVRLELGASRGTVLVDSLSAGDVLGLS